MKNTNPTAKLDPRFSSPEARPLPWSQMRRLLENAEVYWISTIRSGGRPHVTPMVAVWLDGALYFCTGPGEQKAKNLSANPACTITTGCNTLADDVDVVIEGEAVRINDVAVLQQVAARISAKYGPPFEFTVQDGVFEGGGWVFEVTPQTVFGFGKGKTFSQTRWRF
jgi:general stress protein 26